MPRLIDADALDKELQDTNDALQKMRKNNRFKLMWEDIGAQITTIHEIRRKIMTTPTIDAEPVRHGRWIRMDDSFARWKCSECGAIESHSGWEYCHCGAKMDGGARDVE